MDKEYLPSIQRAKLEKEEKMPDPKDENQIQEGMSFSGKSNPKFVPPDLDAIEKRVNELEESTDQEEPMTLDRKIHLLSKIFPFAIGDMVKNKFNEDGYIDSVSLDDRGVLYLIQYKENRLRWESESKIRKNTPNIDSQDDMDKRPEIKTDIDQ